jgi:hypothetical protein
MLIESPSVSRLLISPKSHRLATSIETLAQNSSASLPPLYCFTGGRRDWLLLVVDLSPRLLLHVSGPETQPKTEEASVGFADYVTS